ncbi:MAG: hypothetical protein ACYCT1_08225 [Steroidobacteraceae bacterium]
MSMTADELAAMDRRVHVLAEVLVTRCRLGQHLPELGSSPEAATEEVGMALDDCRGAVACGQAQRRYLAFVRMAAVCLMHLEEGFGGQPATAADMPSGSMGYAPTLF